MEERFRTGGIGGERRTVLGKRGRGRVGRAEGRRERLVEGNFSTFEMETTFCIDRSHYKMFQLSSRKETVLTFLMPELWIRLLINYLFTGNL